MNSQIFTYLNDNNLLHKSQSGFRPKHSIESALVLTIDSWIKAVNEGKLVCCTLIDLRKAFDLVDHNILLDRLNVTSVEIYLCHGFVPI